MSFDTANDRQAYEVISQSNTHKSERSNDELKRFTFSGPELGNPELNQRSTLKTPTS